MIRSFANSLRSSFAYALTLYNAGGEGALLVEFFSPFRRARQRLAEWHAERRAAAVPLYVPNEATLVIFPAGERVARYARKIVDVGGADLYVLWVEAGQVLSVCITEGDNAFFNVAHLDREMRVASYISLGDERAFNDIVLEAEGSYQITVFPGDGYALRIALSESERQAAA
jgi:hypothetical protein